MERFTRRLALGGLAAVIAGICVLSCGSGDKPTEPAPPPPPKDYPVYGYDLGQTGKLFRYHPTTGVIDSIDIPWRPERGVSVSADGSRLYLSCENSVVVADASTLQLIKELPYETSAPVAVSPDGHMIGIIGNNVIIVDATTYEEVFRDATRVAGLGVFSVDSKSLYSTSAGAIQDSVLPFVYRARSENGVWSAMHHSFGGWWPQWMIPTTDESKWLLYFDVPGLWTYAFSVYDVSLDSMIYLAVLQPGAGSVTMSPDGKYAFFNNPGSMHPGPMPSEAIFVFNIEQNRIEKEIEWEGQIEHVNLTMFMPFQMLVTPDGRWLVSLQAHTHSAVLLYDLQNDCVADYHEFDLNTWLTNLSVQVTTKP